MRVGRRENVGRKPVRPQVGTQGLYACCNGCAHECKIKVNGQKYNYICLPEKRNREKPPVVALKNASWRVRPAGGGGREWFSLDRGTTLLEVLSCSCKNVILLSSGGEIRSARKRRDAPLQAKYGKWSGG